MECGVVVAGLYFCKRKVIVCGVNCIEKGRELILNLSVTSCHLSFQARLLDCFSENETIRIPSEYFCVQLESFVNGEVETERFHQFALAV